MSDNGSILLIDSESQTRQRVSRILVKAGWDVATMRNGAAGIDTAATRSAGLVIVGIPRGGDIDGLNRVRELCPDTPVLALIPPGNSRLSAEALEKGAFYCLPRSFQPDELRAMARIAAEIKRLQASHKRLKKKLVAALAKPDTPASSISVDSTLRCAEKAHIERVLAHTGWNRTAAARILGIDRKTLRNRIKEFGLDKD